MSQCLTDIFNPPIPDIYFGNCIAVAFAKASRRDLAGKYGLETAVEAIGVVVEGLREEVLKGAENWIPGIARFTNERIISIAGSPRFRAGKAKED
ncbi:hypothetical protein AAC387_Pa11g2229 [Persea americana]